MAKPSFDALVQRHVRESLQGRAFARFETRFQLMWVVGSLVPVVLSLPVAAGSLVMAVTSAVGAVSYMSSPPSRAGACTGACGPPGDRAAGPAVAGRLSPAGCSSLSTSAASSAGSLSPKVA